MGYVSVAVRSKTPSGVAGFLCNQWQLSRGIGGSFAMESVATFVWNEWQLCYGISGSFGVEYAFRPVGSRTTPERLSMLGQECGDNMPQEQGHTRA